MSEIRFKAKKLTLVRPITALYCDEPDQDQPSSRIEELADTFCAVLFWVFLLFVILARCGSDAKAFPSAVRMGYTSCEACHLDPNGGNVLLPYGRSAGEEMATWGPEGSGRLLGFAPDTKWALAGGDIRAAATNWVYDTDLGQMSAQSRQNDKAFLMQAEGELALHPSMSIWLDATLGYYGPDHDRELRRSFVLWKPGNYFTAKAGRFVPAYGVMTPDHTAATREGLGLGEGGEVLAAEVAARSEIGEIVATETFATDVDLNVGAHSGYSLYGGDPGWAARIAAYAFKSTFGVSAWRRPSDTVAGAFATVAVTRWIYVLAEVDRDRDRVLEYDRDVAWAEVGWEVVQGLTLQTTAEYEDGGRYGLGFDWIPFPHFQVSSWVKKKADVWSAAGVAHVWL